MFFPLHFNGIGTNGGKVNDVNVIGIKRVSRKGLNLVGVNQRWGSRIGIIRNSVKNSLPTEDINGIVNVGGVDDVFRYGIN